jgi:hypothetical protein
MAAERLVAVAVAVAAGVAHTAEFFVQSAAVVAAAAVALLTQLIQQGAASIQARLLLIAASRVEQELYLPQEMAEQAVLNQFLGAALAAMAVIGAQTEVVV